MHYSLYFCGGGAYFLHTEKKQNEQIEKLSSSVEKLLAQSNKNYISFTSNCGTHFDYLAIGNSITKHQKCDYWWNEIGMAATSEAHDYFHLVVSYLEKQHGTINSFPLNFSNWEIQSTDRAETYTIIEPILNKDIDLITIQLGENVADTATLKKDYTELINFIKINAPNAHIVIIGSFWENIVIENIKKEVAQDMAITYVDISMLWNQEEYYCGIGTKVFDENGGEHIVEHKGVSIHPNDKGMQYIADAIIQCIRETKCVP